MSGRSLGLLALACAVLAYPGFRLGAEIGEHVGYDASAEFAFGTALTLGALAVVLGIAAAIRSARGRNASVALAVLAAVAGIAVIAVTVWVFLLALSG